MTEETQIRVETELVDTLKAMGLKGENYSAVLRRALEGGYVNIPVSIELYEFCRHLAAGLQRREPTIIDVGDTLSRAISKAGVALGYKGERFTDWGVLKAKDAKIVTYLGIDDPYTQLSITLTEAMKALIENHGVKTLEPILEQTLKVLVEGKAEGLLGEEA